MSKYSIHQKRLLRLKNKITPREISSNELISTLKTKYHCSGETENFLNSTWYHMYAKNYLHKFGEHLDPAGISAYEIKKNEMSKKLEAHDPDENVFFVVEDKHCFFETNSNDLFCEMSLLRSVSFDDYNNETAELFDLLSIIEQYKEYASDKDSR